MKYDIGTTVGFTNSDESTQVLGIVYDSRITEDEEGLEYEMYSIEWQDDFDRDEEYTVEDVDILVETYNSMVKECSK